MSKLTYSEQLKHPQWQRKRLEMLDRDNFTCRTCARDDKTLHVHHKTYIKGRLAWEYEDSNFETLCEECHEVAHSHKSRMDQVLAQYPSEMWGSLASLLIGYGEEYVDPSFWEHSEGLMARVGQLAWFAMNFTESSAFEVVDLCKELGPDAVLQALRSARIAEVEGQ